MLSALVLLQTAAAAPAPPTDMMVIEASPADRAAYIKQGNGCADVYPASEDVVVCASRAKDPSDINALAAIFEAKPLRPAWRMLGGEGAVQAEQRSTPMGSAPAVMGSFKLKF